jgi:hypothetical protein
VRLYDDRHKNGKAPARAGFTKKLIAESCLIRY